MRKIFLTAVVMMFMMSCSAQTKKLSDYKGTTFVPTLETKIDPNKNAIYCATLLFAWDDIRKTVNNTIEVPDSQKALKALDASRSYKNVLKKDEYKVKTKMMENNITAIATFEKKLSFVKRFESFKNDLSFEGKKVPSFGLTGDAKYEVKKQIKILYYKDDANFILELSCKDEAHKIVLFKSSKTYTSMAEMNSEAQRLIKENEDKLLDKVDYWKYNINAKDMVMIPKFAFDIEHDYTTLLGSNCTINKVRYTVTKAYQKNAFELDESGAKVKSASKVRLSKSAPVKAKAFTPKLMLLDKPFFLMMKRKDQINPYFSMFIKNVALMQTK